MPGRAPVALSVFVAALLACCPSAVARRAGFLAPVPVAGTSVSAGETPVECANPKGDVLVLWADTLSQHTAQLDGVFRSAGGSFGSTEMVAPPFTRQYEGVSNIQFEPDCALASDGVAAVAWTLPAPSSTGPRSVELSLRPAGGHWSNPVRLSAQGKNAIAPSVAIDAAGDVVVSWLVPDKEGVDSLFVQERLASGKFLPAGALGVTSLYDRPAPVGFLGPGKPIVIWQTAAQLDASTSSGGSWHTAGVASPFSNAKGYGLASAVFVGGEALAVSDASTGIVARTWQAGAWGPADLVHPGQSGGYPYGVLDGKGGEYVAVDKNGDGVQVFGRAAGGVWGSLLSEPGNIESAGGGIAVDAAGDLALVWEDEVKSTNSGSPTYATAVAVRPAGASSWNSEDTMLGHTASPIVSGSGDTVAAGTTQRDALALVEYQQ